MRKGTPEGRREGGRERGKIDLPGVFITITPFLVAAGRSILSTPTPARPMTTSLSAAAITSPVT